MNEIQKEQRENALGRSGYKCYVCGASLNGKQPQYAHRIANTKTNRSKYGSFFVDHTLNGEMVCSLECNQALNIGFNKGAVLELMASILLFEMRKFKNGK